MVVDDLRMTSIDVDDVKAWLDCKKPRAVQGRNSDGFIPAYVPRIFCTNWEPAEFFPGEYQLSKQRRTIDRRHRWQKVAADVRVLSSADAAEEAPSTPAKPKSVGERTELIHGLLSLSPGSREALFGLVDKFGSSASTSKAPLPSSASSSAAPPPSSASSPTAPPLPTQASATCPEEEEVDPEEDPFGFEGRLD